MVVLTLCSACDRGAAPTNSYQNKSAKPVVPNNDELITLVKTTLNDFSDAVQKEDFLAFHNTLYYELKMQKSADDLKEAFIDFVKDKDKFNLRNAIATLDPVFDPAPKIEYIKGLDALVAEGSFATKPTKTMFTLRYAWHGGSWKLMTINVKTAAK